MGLTSPSVFFFPAKRLLTRNSSTRVAIVGSGPSGLYACASLLRRLPWLKVDVIEAAPVPFGLVRYGVAPDHQDVKNCIHSFEKMFSSHGDRLSLLCNVRVGEGKNEVSIPDLRLRYTAVLLAYGASRPRKLDIPGANATNVLSGSEFVSWYSGHPSSHPPLLNMDNAVVIGNGNVALDCARVLALGGRLEHTDVPQSALELLNASKVKKIKIVGRRGPGDISFTIKELREQFRVDGWRGGVEMNEEDEKKLRESLSKLERPRKRIMQVLLDNIGLHKGDNTCSFLFRRKPSRIVADENGRVKSIVFELSNGKKEEIEAGLVIASLGFEPVLLDGLPKDSKGHLAMRDECRVATEGEGGLLYAAGWCVRGAKGVIADSQEAASRVASLMAPDLKEGKNDEGLVGLLKEKNIKWSGWNDWLQLDEKEKKEGEKRGKIREKFVAF